MLMTVDDRELQFRNDEAHFVLSDRFEAILSERSEAILLSLLIDDIESKSDSDPLPDNDTLIRFADGTLRGGAKKDIQTLANNNFSAMITIAEYVKLFTHIRLLANKWFGWKGAILHGIDRLPTKEDWAAHCERCPRSKARSRVAYFVLSPLRWLLNFVSPSSSNTNTKSSSAGSRLFALGGWVSTAVMLCVFMLSQSLDWKADQPTTKSEPTVSPKDIGGNLLSPISAVLFPNTDDEETIEYSIQHIESLLGKHPDSLELHLALARLCFTREQLLSDSQERDRMRNLGETAVHKFRELEQKSSFLK